MNEPEYLTETEYDTEQQDIETLNDNHLAIQGNVFDTWNKILENGIILETQKRNHSNNWREWVSKYLQFSIRYVNMYLLVSKNASLLYTSYPQLEDLGTPIPKNGTRGQVVDKLSFSPKYVCITTRVEYTINVSYKILTTRIFIRRASGTFKFPRL